MMTIDSLPLRRLSDPDLIAQVHDAVQAERHASARLIALLMELDERRIYLGEGFSSLFTYCTRALHLSEHATYNRIETARAARRFPIVLKLIEQGEVTLTTVRMLAPHLTSENHRDVLARARHNQARRGTACGRALPTARCASHDSKAAGAPTGRGTITTTTITTAGIGDAAAGDGRRNRLRRKAGVRTISFSAGRLTSCRGEAIGA